MPYPGDTTGILGAPRHPQDASGVLRIAEYPCARVHIGVIHQWRIGIGNVIEDCLEFGVWRTENDLLDNKNILSMCYTEWRRFKGSVLPGHHVSWDVSWCTMLRAPDTAASLCLQPYSGSPWLLPGVVPFGSAAAAELARCSRRRTRPEGSFLRLHSSAGRRDPSSSRLQSAPCSSSTRTTSACARAAAKCSAQLLMISGPSTCTSRPEWCLRSASAPPWHSSRTTCGHPWQAATCSGVIPG